MCCCGLGLGASVNLSLLNLSLRDGVLPEWSIASELLFFSSFPRVNDKREGDVFTTKRLPMRGPTALFLSTVWTLFFAACRFHHVVATTPSPFFPQVRTVLLPIASRPASFYLTRSRVSRLTGILRGQQFRFPSPVL
jgi:hypothetical protein